MHGAARFVKPAIGLLLLAACFAAGESRAQSQIREELIGLSTPIPMAAYSARPEGDGPFPLVVMNHGVAIGSLERGFFPQVEFRDAALWFARRGYLVIAPIRPGYGVSALDRPERAMFPIYFAEIGSCDNPDFHKPGLAIARIVQWTIDYAVQQGLAKPAEVLVVGQSGGGWGALALSSQNLPRVRAIIAFAAGRGGHMDGKPNSNCAPDRLVSAAGDFGKTARTPLLMIYSRNDTYFGPELSKRLSDAYRQAGGRAEYHLVRAFGADGHLLIDSAEAIPIWEPLVVDFLERHK